MVLPNIHVLCSVLDALFVANQNTTHTMLSKATPVNILAYSSGVATHLMYFHFFFFIHVHPCHADMLNSSCNEAIAVQALASTFLGGLRVCLMYILWWP